MLAFASASVAYQIPASVPVMRIVDSNLDTAASLRAALDPTMDTMNANSSSMCNRRNQRRLRHSARNSLASHEVAIDLRNWQADAERNDLQPSCKVVG